MFFLYEVDHTETAVPLFPMPCFVVAILTWLLIFGLVQMIFMDSLRVELCNLM